MFLQNLEHSPSCDTDTFISLRILLININKYKYKYSTAIMLFWFIKNYGIQMANKELLQDCKSQI